MPRSVSPGCSAWPAAPSVELLLGPLYHLPRSEDRLLALREAARVLKPTGVVHAAAISRWAVRLDGILVQRFHENHPVLAKVVDEMERTGVMGVRPPRMCRWAPLAIG